MWNDKDYSEMELKAALAFWSQYHSFGSRRRVRDAIKYYRQYHTKTEKADQMLEWLRKQVEAGRCA